MGTDGSPAAMDMEETRAVEGLRSYQHELIQLCLNSNVLVSLDTGSGKTVIAAGVIQQKLPALKAAGKVAVFLAPTNPLVAQQFEVLQKASFKVKEYHGDVGTNHLANWDKAAWTAEWQALDVLVMTPEVLLHILAHGYMSLADVGLLVFDECHHCHHNHPYNQLMEDCYRPLPVGARPQVLALTASPDGMVQNKRKSKRLDCGLQTNLDCTLLSVTGRHELEEYVHLPNIELVTYDPINHDERCKQALQELDSAVELMTAAARCERVGEQLRKRLMLADGGLTDPVLMEDIVPGLAHADTGTSSTEAAQLERQLRAVRKCLDQLGPWCAAAAAYLDLFGPSRGGDAVLLAATAPGGVGGEVQGGLETEEAATLSSLMVAHLGIVEQLSLRTLGEDPLLPQTDLDAAREQHVVPGGLQWRTSALVQLAARVALTETVQVLARLLVRDERRRKQLVGAFAAEAARDLRRRADGGWQPFAAVLMRQVSWQALQQACLPPHLAAAAASRSGGAVGGCGSSIWGGGSSTWTGCQLVTPKVVRMLRYLKRSYHLGGGGDGWAAMVFVETRLSALVLSRLINSLPGVRAQLRASQFVGTSMMHQKAQQQAMESFRQGQVNVLVATNVGSEGMDFRFCRLVVAMDEPQTVTHFIQCRGRARAQDSTYALMAAKGAEQRCRELARKAMVLAEEAHERSLLNREYLEVGSREHQFEPLPISSEDVLETPAGARATMRLAQPMLAEYCALLPGADGCTILQPVYLDTVEPEGKRATVCLPSNSGLTTPICGKPQPRKHLARQSAALAALRALHTAGRLNDHLQPCWGCRSVEQLEAQAVGRYHASRLLPEQLHGRMLPPAAAAVHAIAMEAATAAQEATASAAASAAGAKGAASSRVGGQGAVGVTAAGGAVQEGKAAQVALAVSKDAARVVTGGVTAGSAVAQMQSSGRTVAMDGDVGSARHTAAAAAAAAGEVAAVRRAVAAAAQHGVPLPGVPDTPAMLHLYTFTFHQQPKVPSYEHAGPAAAAAERESAPVFLRDSFDAAARHTHGFGVLLWERIPVDSLPAFGVWPPGYEGQQSLVTVECVGPVQLQPAQLAALAACQRVLERHVTLPRLLRRAAQPHRVAAAAGAAVGGDGAAGANGEHAEPGAQQNAKGCNAHGNSMGGGSVLEGAGNDNTAQPVANGTHAGHTNGSGRIGGSFADAPEATSMAVDDAEQASTAEDGIAAAVPAAKGPQPFNALRMMNHVGFTHLQAAMGVPQLPQPQQQEQQQQAEREQEEGQADQQACQAQQLKHAKDRQQGRDPQQPAAQHGGDPQQQQNDSSQQQADEPRWMRHNRPVPLSYFLVPVSACAACLQQQQQEQQRAGKVQAPAKCAAGATAIGLHANGTAGISGTMNGNGTSIANHVPPVNGHADTGAAQTCSSANGQVCQQADGHDVVKQHGSTCGCSYQSPEPCSTPDSKAPHVRVNWDLVRVLAAGPLPALHLVRAAADLAAAGNRKADGRTVNSTHTPNGRTPDGSCTAQSDCPNGAATSHAAASSPAAAARRTTALCSSSTCDHVDALAAEAAMAAAAMLAAGEQPAAVQPHEVVAAAGLLQGRVLITQHHSQMWRCGGLSHLTPATPVDWLPAVAAAKRGIEVTGMAVNGQPADGTVVEKEGKQQRVLEVHADMMEAAAASDGGAAAAGPAKGGHFRDHQEYFAVKYGIHVQPGLPMLDVGRGRGIADDCCLSPPQPLGPTAAAAHCGAPAAGAGQLDGHAAGAVGGTGAAAAPCQQPLLGKRAAEAAVNGAPDSAPAPSRRRRLDAAGNSAVVPLTTQQQASCQLQQQQQQQQEESEQQQQQESSAPGKGSRGACCLPLEVCWVLPLPGAAWSQLLLLPALMYRLEGLLRLQGMQQQLARALPASVAMPSPGLLLSAITPRQAKEQHSLERLEFLGDAILKYLISAYLIRQTPSGTEGELSVEKAKLVRNFHLAHLAELALGGGEPLHAFLRLFFYDKRLCTPSGMARALEGEYQGKRKADLLEALIGALYLTAAAQEDIKAASSDRSNSRGSNGSVCAAQQQPGSSLVSHAGLLAAAQLCEKLGMVKPGCAHMAAEAPEWPTSPLPAALDSDARRLANELAPVLGSYSFRRPALLQQALTHVSVLGAPSYQRLELLGDAVLDVLVSLQLLLVEEDGRTVLLQPGQLTVLRAHHVRNRNLAHASVQAGLHRWLRARRAALPWISEGLAAGAAPPPLPAAAARTAAALAAAGDGACVAEDDAVWLQVWARVKGEQQAQGGESQGLLQKHKIMADIVESVTAAVFVDSGGDWDATWAAVSSIIDMRDLTQQLVGSRASRGATACDSGPAEDGEDDGEAVAANSPSTAAPMLLN